MNNDFESREMKVKILSKNYIKIIKALNLMNKSWFNLIKINNISCSVTKKTWLVNLQTVNLLNLKVNKS